jgi:hypothetical protein
VDCETGMVTDITVTPGLKKEYIKAFEKMCSNIEDYCVKRQILYFKAPIQTPFDELILRIFRAGGFLD